MSLNGLINSNGLVSFHMKETFLVLTYAVSQNSKAYYESDVTKLKGVVHKLRNSFFKIKTFLSLSILYIEYMDNL